MHRLHLSSSKALGVLLASLSLTWAALAADHLDTPTVTADPAADIGDLFAWTSSDGRRLNLIMDIVGRRFSDRIQYVFHVDSGRQFGTTTTTTEILCQFDVSNADECWLGDADFVRGDASKPDGLEGVKKRFKVFAGLRDDPYFNNVRGTRAALDFAVAAIQIGAASQDASGFFKFDGAASKQIRERCA